MPKRKSIPEDKNSRQKSIEKKLLEQKKLIAQMARFPEMNPGPVLRMSIEGKILLSNKAVKTVFKKDLLNKNWKTIRKEITDEVWKQIISSGKIIPIEINVGDKCFVFHHRRDKLSDLVFAYGSDITLNKQNEKKLKEQKTAMTAMARFPDMNPGPVIRMDLKGKIILSNIAAQHVFGRNITGSSWLRICPGLTTVKWNEIRESENIYPYEIKIGEKEFVFTHRRDLKTNLVFVYGADITQQKATERQLRYSEKMASLGELTSGVAHEIQNPLNFVNNFSELNMELLKEVRNEFDQGNFQEVKSLLDDITSNEQKISHHGKRADAIVKSMLLHSRSSAGEKELTDINALCEEFLKLAYLGMKAKDYAFSVTLEKLLDGTVGKINIIPQDMGRVILNLINNAFYAVNEKAKQNIDGYNPTVIISTKKTNGKIEIGIKDNGNGIPDAVKEKIFQPFFTTKPTGHGTGLGLSLSYDTVKAHGGEIKAENNPAGGAMFIVMIPYQ